MEPMKIGRSGTVAEVEIDRRLRGGTRAREALWLRFRQHAELEPGGRLSVMGRALCTAGQMHAYASRRRADFPDIAGVYAACGDKYGVRGDVAYCQMLLETRGWTASQFALPVAGARTTPSWVPPDLSDWTAEEAVDNQMRLLREFAERDLSAARIRAGTPAAEKGRLRHPDVPLPVRSWEDLGSGGWPGVVDSRYGSDIAAIWRNMKEWARDSG